MTEKTYISKGWGFKWGQFFERAGHDIEIDLSNKPPIIAGNVRGAINHGGVIIEVETPLRAIKKVQQ